MAQPPAPISSCARYMADTLSIIVICLFFTTLFIGFFHPIWFDDIGYPIASARAGYDGWQAISPVPECQSMFGMRIPATLLPGRLIAWAGHTVTDDFITMKFMALAVLLTWIGYLSWFVKRILFPQWTWLQTVALVTAVAGMGKVTVFLLNNRPETSMLLVITLFASLPFLLRHYTRPCRFCLPALACAVLIAQSFFFSAHPKALLYAPLIILATCYTFASNRRLLLPVLIIMGITILQGWLYWQAKTSCPEFLPAHTFLSRQSVAIGLLSTDPMLFFGQFLSNLLNSGRYIRGIFLPQYVNNASILVSGLITVTAAGLGYLIVLGAILHVTERSRPRRWHLPEILIPAALLAALLMQAGLLTSKPAYNSALIWPCLFLPALLLLAHTGNRGPQWAGLSICLWLLGVSAISQAVLAYTALPQTITTVQTAAKSEYRYMRPFVLSPFNYSIKRQQILEAAAQCGIPPDRSARHVVVDATTYLALRRTYQPFFKANIEHTGQDFLHFLQAYPISGVVMLCRHMPASWQAAATRVQDICCLKPEDIGRIAEPPEPQPVEPEVLPQNP